MDAGVRPRFRIKRTKANYTNRVKVFICHALAWGLAFALPIAALVIVYPVKLVGSAPAIARNTAEAIDALSGVLAPAIESATAREQTPEAIRYSLRARDSQWQRFISACFAITLLISLIIEIVWRCMFLSPLRLSKAAPRAVITYRLFLLMIALINAVFALLCYFLGLKFVSGRGFWDYLVCFSGYALNVLAAFICFRLAAPPAISGKHAFFRRL